jgi:hypothetical protein
MVSLSTNQAGKLKIVSAFLFPAMLETAVPVNPAFTG